jgi:FkbM family methyltransferase
MLQRGDPTPSAGCQPPHCWDTLACLGEQCMTWSTARTRIAAVSGGWRQALLDVTLQVEAKLKGDSGRNCVVCNAAALARNPAYPREVWNVSGGVDHFADLPLSAKSLLEKSKVGRRLGRLGRERMFNMSDAPALLPEQTLYFNLFRRYPPKHKQPVTFPCSSARGEDAAVLHSFFTDWETGEPLRDGTFLEIGGVNGLTESNTWIFEVCMGWQGVLVEAHPRFFMSLRRNRPRSLNLRMAACPEASGWVNYTASRDTTAGVLTTSGATIKDPKLRKYMRVECGNLGGRLRDLGVTRLDFASIDVEGSELMVTKSLLETPGLSIGVLLVEVRSDGQRLGLVEQLLGHGMRYVGKFAARGTYINKVVDDAYVNMSHMRTYYPRSSALRS